MEQIKFLAEKEKSSKTQNEPQQTASGAEIAKLMNSGRISVIKMHRQFVAECQKMVANNTLFYGITAPPSLIQTAPMQVAGLLPITFNKMDMNQDKVYIGNVLNVTSIEDAGGLGIFPSIRLVLQDENFDCIRAYIYNSPHKDARVVQEKFGFGAKFSILNPYLRLAADGIAGIRVDDIGSFVGHSQRGNSKRCRYCGSDDSQLCCGKCLQANYCNANCQQLDWKILKHKLICKPHK